MHNRWYRQAVACTALAILAFQCGGADASAAVPRHIERSLGATTATVDVATTSNDTAQGQIRLREHGRILAQYTFTEDQPTDYRVLRLLHIPGWASPLILFTTTHCSRDCYTQVIALRFHRGSDALENLEQVSIDWDVHGQRPSHQWHLSNPIRLTSTYFGASRPLASEGTSTYYLVSRNGGQPLLIITKKGSRQGMDEPYSPPKRFFRETPNQGCFDVYNAPHAKITLAPCDRAAERGDYAPTASISRHIGNAIVTIDTKTHDTLNGAVLKLTLPTKTQHTIIQTFDDIALWPATPVAATPLISATESSMIVTVGVPEGAPLGSLNIFIKFGPSDVRQLPSYPLAIGKAWKTFSPRGRITASVRMAPIEIYRYDTKAGDEVLQRNIFSFVTATNGDTFVLQESFDPREESAPSIPPCIELYRESGDVTAWPCASPSSPYRHARLCSAVQKIEAPIKLANATIMCPDCLRSATGCISDGVNIAG